VIRYQRVLEAVTYRFCKATGGNACAVLWPARLFPTLGDTREARGLAYWHKSMRCASCPAKNPQGAKFCIQCATPIRRRCQKCSFENPFEARSCAQCATSLSEREAQPSKVAAVPDSSAILLTLDNRVPQTIKGERKTVTALFADIKGSTELMRDLDLDEERTTLAEIYNLSTEGFDTADLKKAKTSLDELSVNSGEH
jgi:ribosomal protein L40E